MRRFTITLATIPKVNVIPPIKRPWFQFTYVFKAEPTAASRVFPGLVMTVVNHSTTLVNVLEVKLVRREKHTTLHLPR